MAEAPPWGGADPLGEALHFLRVTGTFYCRSELTAPWGLSLPAMPGCLWFHVVTSGHGMLEVGGDDPLALGPGDLALVPHGEGHRLRSDPAAPAPSIHTLHHDYESDRYAILRHGGGGVATQLVCGAVRVDQPAARELVSLLPQVIYVQPAGFGRPERLQSVLRLMAAEASEVRAGGEAVLTRLGDIVVIQAIRSWIEESPAAQVGWLGALQDPQVGRAIALIHRDPARAWTLASLARELPMSRSGFAARFSELVGEPAMHYVTRWRMNLALDWLSEESTGVRDVASRLGYASEAAFSRAFKRTHGRSPGSVRRDARSLPADRGAA